MRWREREEEETRIKPQKPSRTLSSHASQIPMLLSFQFSCGAYHGRVVSVAPFFTVIPSRVYGFFLLLSGARRTCVHHVVLWQRKSQGPKDEKTDDNNTKPIPIIICIIIYFCFGGQESFVFCLWMTFSLMGLNLALKVNPPRKPQQSTMLFKYNLLFEHKQLQLHFTAPHLHN